MLKRNIVKISLFITISLLSSSSICNGNENDRLLLHIKNKISACRSKKDAKRFLYYVNEVIDIVQDSFSKLASHRRSNDEYRIKKNLLKNYFENEAWVQVSSVNSPLIITQNIYDYLNRLTNYKDRYEKVELYFDKEYLAFGNIHEFGSKNNKSYEFNLAASQIFKGYIGDNIQYSDATIKVFNFIFKKVGNSWTLKIRSITAKETFSESYYDNNKGKIWLKKNF